MTTRPKPEECESCGHSTAALKFFESRDARGADQEDTPWVLRSKWLCRLCDAVGSASVANREIPDGLVRMLNVILEAVERRQ